MIQFLFVVFVYKINILYIFHFFYSFHFNSLSENLFIKLDADKELDFAFYLACASTSTAEI